MSFQRLSILGFGLLGASIAQAVREHLSGCAITAYDLRSDQIQPYLGPKLSRAASVAAAVHEADCVVIAVPPEQVKALLMQVAPALPANAIVTDVASVKRGIVADAELTLSPPSRFVGGHPMAGGERSGSANARAELFEGAAVVLTPTPTTDASAVDAVQAFWEELGGHVHRMSPDEHDSVMARVSHFPHVLAAAIMHVVPPQAGVFAGPGFRDMTRIAAGDPELWRQILVSNADQVRLVLKSMQQQMHDLDRLLQPARRSDLHRWLDAAAAGRRSLDGIS